MFRPAALRPLVALLLIAAPAKARDPVLRLPIDCTLGESCFIQNYVDDDFGPGAADFTCGPLTYDGHKGTDFALPDLAAMERGVRVLAAAPGRVSAVRDGMPDQVQEGRGGAEVEGRECGNGVVIEHGGGWETQYCHMKQGSIRVPVGRRIGAGTELGLVGLSGETQFPHLHLTVRHDGEVVDPFVPSGIVTCGGTTERSLFSSQPAYRPGGLVAIGLAGAAPEFDAVKSGTPLPGLAPEAPLVLWAHLFGTRAGDVLRFQIEGPAGAILDGEVALDRTQARAFRFAGKKAAGWPPGSYRGTVVLVRNGTELERRETEAVLAK